MSNIFLQILLINHLLHPGLGQKLLLILTEGFAGSYYYRYSHLPAFQFFETNGVWSDLLYPVFPSLSLPNQYTIVTGKYPTNHGIVSSYFHDRNLNSYFLGGTSDSDFQIHWWNWNKTEPIWVTAYKSYVSTALFHWPGCQVEFTTPPEPAKSCIPLRFGSNSPTLNVDNVQAVLEATRNYDFVLAYHDGINKAGENFGSAAFRKGNNSEIHAFAEVVEEIISEAQSRIDLNVIIMSDHGIKDVSRENRRFLEQYLDMNLVETTLGFGAVKQIVPKRGQGNKIFDMLRYRRSIPNVRIYYTSPRMSDLPSWYRYKKTERISELILLAQPGYAVFTNNSDKQIPAPSNSDWRPAGVSGYNNHYPDMLGIFLAYGPNFKSGYRKGAARLVDVYSVMCNILGLNCPNGDGSLERMKDILVLYSSSVSRPCFLSILILSFFMALFLVIV